MTANPAEKREARMVAGQQDPDTEGNVTGMVASFGDVTERLRSEEELRRRDAISEAVRFAAERLLRQTGTWEQGVQEVLERFGEATGVSRVYVFENYTGDDGEVWATNTHEWVAQGVSAQIDNPVLQALLYRAPGFSRWAEAFSRGETLYGHVRYLPEIERPEPEAEGTLSYVLVPVFVEGAWWGFIGFDECVAERDFSAAELDALKAAADTLGAAIGRNRAEQALKQECDFSAAVLDTAGSLVVVFDMEGRIVRFNRACERLTGYPPDDLVGNRRVSYGDLIHSDDREAVWEKVQAGIEERRPFQLTYRMTAASGGLHGLPGGFAEALEASWRAGAQSSVLSAFRHREPRLVRDARRLLLDDPLYGPAHPFVREMPWDTVLIVPLIAAGRAVGAISVYYLPEREPAEDEMTFLGAVADQTAVVVVENARLYEQAQSAAALEERQRLARELHDSVSQALYGIALGAKTARTLLDRDPNRVADPLDYVLSLAEAGLAEMRALIFELRPESLENEGLIAALEKHAAALRARHGIDVRATIICEEPDVPLEAKEALYRVAQEALHNTVKHARASSLELKLECGTDGITLEIGDDGVGFDPSGDFPGHLGLKSMRERAERHAGGREQIGKGRPHPCAHSYRMTDGVPPTPIKSQRVGRCRTRLTSAQGLPIRRRVPRDYS